MPAKNAGLFLAECLNSIEKQTYLNWELLVINDHSSDNTLEILKAHELKDSRIKVADNSGKGIIDALRKAYSLSQGQFITRMDADDRMHPTKLATMIEAALDKGPGSLIIGGVSYFSAGDLGAGYQRYAAWLNSLTNTNSNFKEIYQECVVPSPCWMVHRADLNTCGGFNSSRYPEDYDLCFRFYEQGLEVVGISDVLHEWRDYPTRSSRTDPNYADNRFLDLKLDYFCKLEIKKDKDLILWGAGKKGKTIARYLLKIGQEFTWICNNDRKIGVKIDGKVLHHTKQILELGNPQLIIAVANPFDKQEIDHQLTSMGLESGLDFWHFA